MKTKNITPRNLDFFRFIILLLFFLFPPLSALKAEEPIGWVDLGLYGGQIYTIAIDPADSNTILAGSYYGDGLFKSTDGGENWESVDGFRNKIVYSISFDPENHQVIWVATCYYIYKSEDGGRTWKSYDPALNFGPFRFYYSLAIDPEDGDTVYVGTSGPLGFYTGGGIYKTIDGGKTWQKTSLIADHNVWGLAVDPQNSKKIWAVTGPEWVSKGSIYRSDDGGTTWSKVQTGLDKGWFYSVKVNPRNSNIVFVGGEKGLFKTKNGGRTWSQLKPNSWCRGFVFDPEEPDILFISWYDQENDETLISKSIDGGESWVSHDIYPLEFLCLSINPENNHILYGGDANLGVYKSNDEGRNWQAIRQGIRANQVYASAISPSGKLLVGSEAGIFLRNGAGTWEELLNLPGISVAISPEDENIIYAGSHWGFGKSIDSGKTWSFIYIPAEDSNKVSSIAISPQNQEVLYLGIFYASGTRGEIYKSTDGGESIKLIGTFSEPINLVKVNPKSNKVVYAGSGLFYAPEISGALYRSTDGGKNWEKTALTGKVINAIAIDPKQPNIIYAGCGGGSGFYSGLFKSIDGGDTWEEKDFGIPEDAAIMDIEVDPDNTSILYAATHRHGIYISHNAGNYWTLLGLSDFWIYNLLISGSNPFTSKLKLINGYKSVLSSTTIYAGSGSGILEFTGSGLGVITGTVTDAMTGLGITGATISTDTGGVALSLSGHYVMNTPAGQCTVTASMNGYQSSSIPGVLVMSGEDTTVNFILTPLEVQNNPPHIPANPYPANGATNQPLNLTLSWKGGDPDRDTVTYDVFLGTQNIPLLIKRNHPRTRYNLDSLKPSTIYYWKILARDSKGEESEGPIWHFATGEESCSQSPCPVSLVLGGEEESLTLLRRFRDEVLAKDGQGKRYITLFYRHAPEISLLLNKDPKLKLKTIGTIKELLPQIRSLLKGKEARFTPKIIEEIESLLDQFKAQASPGLKRTIEAIKEKWNQEVHDVPPLIARSRLFDLSLPSP